MNNTATEKQISFIKSLAQDRQPDERVEKVLELGRSLWRNRAFDRSAASDVIDALKAIPRSEQKSAPTEAPEGMHKIGNQIFKVQRAVHGSGNLYAKELLVTEPDCGGCANGEPCESGCHWTARFEYAPGAIKRLDESTMMSLEQAKEFGVLYGTCCVCGRTLTNEDSIADGIGPVCAGKF